MGARATTRVLVSSAYVKTLDSEVQASLTGAHRCERQVPQARRMGTGQRLPAVE